MLQLRARHWGALTVAFAVAGVVVGGPVFAAQPAQNAGGSCVVEAPTAGAPAAYQSLKVCASFDKSAYRSSDLVKLTVSITNLGHATAKGVWMQLPYNSFRSFGPASSLFITPGLAGTDIPAGATLVREQDGYAFDPASGTVTFSEPAYQGGGSGNAYGKPATVSASVTPVVAPYGGLVYVDANGNGRPDSGEGLPGVRVSLTGPFDGLAGSIPAPTHDATTDAQGNFRFDSLPGGSYYEHIAPPKGWTVRAPDTTLVIDGSPGQTGVQLVASRPVADVLHAAIAFDRTSYHVGEPAGVTITLANVGPTAITGIQSACGLSGSPAAMLGVGAGWEVLRSPGLTLAAGKTTVLHLSEIVPVGALGVGTVYLDCVFGPNLDTNLGNGVDGRASAKALPPVTPTIDFTVHLINDKPLGDKVLAGVLLLDPSSHDPVAVRFGGNSDSLEFAGTPAGRYDVVVTGPWHLAPGQSAVLDTANVTPGGVVDLHVLPGAQPPVPPGPPSPTGSSTPGAPSSSPTAASSAPGAVGPVVASSGGTRNLAHTGVDAVWPVIAGLALLVAGAGAVLITRRRRTAR